MDLTEEKSDLANNKKAIVPFRISRLIQCSSIPFFLYGTWSRSISVMGKIITDFPDVCYHPDSFHTYLQVPDL